MSMNEAKGKLIAKISKEIEENWEDIEQDLARIDGNLKIGINIKAARSGNKLDFAGKLTGTKPATVNYGDFEFDVDLDQPDMLEEAEKKAGEGDNDNS